MSAYSSARDGWRRSPRAWLLTGVAGFIGSHLLEELLRLDQRVVGLDNFSTGHRKNLESVRSRLTSGQWENFDCREGDIRNVELCQAACAGVDFVLHQAGFVSVPLSFENPLSCHAVNATGTLNLLQAARENHVSRFVFASSSAVYGDKQTVPQTEDAVGEALSPYALSKASAEAFADFYTRVHGLSCCALRYFNVFGPRQDPAGGYAAVIPRWIIRLLAGETCRIHGTGEQTRDFCPVANVVQANLLAVANHAGTGAYNVALGGSTSLNTLYRLLADAIGSPLEPIYEGERAGDIRHSTASVAKVVRELGYDSRADMASALVETIHWYRSRSATDSTFPAAGTGVP